MMDENTVSVAKLLAILDNNRDIQTILSDVADEARRIGQCEHVFLSRYVSITRSFEPVLCRSSMAPACVSLRQKFMSERYLDNRVVILDDLTRYNYRLRPDAARLGFQSMLGIPIMGQRGLLGIIECFSQKPAHFSGEMGDSLLLLARQVALILDRAEQDKICKWLSIENDFVHEVQKSEQLSDGLLLYRLGETLVSLLEPDGIAVFGLEFNVAGDVLQEVMAKGFSMKDINMLRKAINLDFLDKLQKLSVQGEKPVFLKHPSQGKLLYIAPVIWQARLAGIIVYFWTKAKPDDDLVTMEQFAGRILDYTGITMKRNAVYSNIQRISFHDALTGLANRRLFDYLLAREFTKARQKNTPMSILLIDLDHFKQMNDQYGHQIGDEVLQQLAKVLKQDFRNTNMPARYGGEEFVVILPNTTLENAVSIGEGFRRRIAESAFVAGHQCISLTVSIGVATFQELTGRRFVDPISFLKAADQALYKAKQNGRNQVVAAASLY